MSRQDSLYALCHLSEPSVEEPVSLDHAASPTPSAPPAPPLGSISYFTYVASAMPAADSSSWCVQAQRTPGLSLQALAESVSAPASPLPSLSGLSRVWWDPSRSAGSGGRVPHCAGNLPGLCTTPAPLAAESARSTSGSMWLRPDLAHSLLHTLYDGVGEGSFLPQERPGGTLSARTPRCPVSLPHRRP